MLLLSCKKAKVSLLNLHDKRSILILDNQLFFLLPQIQILDRLIGNLLQSFLR
jgi:hypothetical protein